MPQTQEIRRGPSPEKQALDAARKTVGKFVKGNSGGPLVIKKEGKHYITHVPTLGISDFGTTRTPREPLPARRPHLFPIHPRTNFWSVGMSQRSRTNSTHNKWADQKLVMRYTN